MTPRLPCPHATTAPLPTSPSRGFLTDFLAQAQLPYTDCRYAVYDHEFTTSDGRIADKLFFLSWMPHNATPYSKMAYAQGKGSLRDVLEGVLDVTAARFPFVP